MSLVGRAGCVALVVLLVGACSGDPHPGDTSSTSPPPSTSLTDYSGPPPSTASVQAPTTTSPAPSSGAPVPVGGTDRPQAGPEPTGVPGLAAADPFCAAWAAYAGSVQVLAVAAAFGDQTEDQLTANEEYAAPAVVAAVQQIGDHWPAEIAAEETTVLDEVLGPTQRREQKAVAALTAAGMSAAEVQAMADAWRQVLATRDPQDPQVHGPADNATLDPRIVAAAASFGAAVPAFGDDPSLLVAGVDYPLTRAYLGSNCPDLAASGIGDAI
jgi:hypothetical protein